MYKNHFNLISISLGKTEFSFYTSVLVHMFLVVSSNLSSEMFALSSTSSFIIIFKVALSVLKFFALCFFKILRSRRTGVNRLSHVC